MACRRTIVKAKLTSQKSIAANTVISYDIFNQQGCSAEASGSTGITLKGEGTYLVMFNAAAAEGGTAGIITAQLQRDGVAVPSAYASEYSSATTDTINLAFSDIIEVKKSCNCVDNTTTLTVANTGINASYSNAYLKVIKL